MAAVNRRYAPSGWGRPACVRFERARKNFIGADQFVGRWLCTKGCAYEIDKSYGRILAARFPSGFGGQYVHRATTEAACPSLAGSFEQAQGGPARVGRIAQYWGAEWFVLFQNQENASLTRKKHRQSAVKQCVRVTPQLSSMSVM